MPVSSNQQFVFFIRRLAQSFAFLGLLFQLGTSHAQNVQPLNSNLTEELVSVNIAGTKNQAGVLSMKTGAAQPTKLAVLLPGYPSVVRPVVENGAMVRSLLAGNFLIRARRYLVDDVIASLIVDCHSDSGEQCSSLYQSSKQRQEDVDKLIAEVKRRLPSISEVWLIGTSMGTISSSFMPSHDARAYAGAIHTASITEPYARGSYRELGDFNYKKSPIPQFFIHHSADPCALTTYSGAKKNAEKKNLPLITVNGGSGFQGPACQAFTEHGFRGKEKEVMEMMANIVKNGKAQQLDIN